ncbi:MAG: hypothetical protein ABWY83_01800, partial [Actinomycetota bacterium]
PSVTPGITVRMSSSVSSVVVVSSMADLLSAPVYPNDARAAHPDRHEPYPWLHCRPVEGGT